MAKSIGGHPTKDTRWAAGWANRKTGCAGYYDAGNHMEFTCAYDTLIVCEECMYGSGRKDPNANCNQPRG